MDREPPGGKKTATAGGDDKIRRIGDQLARLTLIEVAELKRHLKQRGLLLRL